MVFQFQAPSSMTESEMRHTNYEGSMLYPEEEPMSLSELQEYEEHVAQGNFPTLVPDRCSYNSVASEGSTASSGSDQQSLSDFMKDYDLLEKLGSGTFGEVYKIQHKVTKEIFARKDVNWNNFTEWQTQQLSQEVRNMMQLDHSSIVRCSSAFVDEDTKFAHIILEYCGGGTLHDVILKARAESMKPTKESHEHMLTEAHIWRYLAQLVSALDHCHNPDPSTERGLLIHRDLKAANVFLSEQDHIKVGDFGLSKMIDFGELAGTFCGTPMYMAPEINERKKYDASVDIWALGCIIYELCELEPAFSSHSRSQIKENIIHGHVRPMVSPYSDTLKDLVKSMMRMDPATRPTAQQLLKHERIRRMNEFLGYQSHPDPSTIQWDQCARVLAEEVTACAEDERRMRHFHNDALRQKAEIIHTLQERCHSLFSLEAVNKAIENERHAAGLRLEQEKKRYKDELEREYQEKERVFLDQQRKRAREFEMATVNANKRRRMHEPGPDFDRRFAELEGQRQALEEREAEANQRDFDFYLQKVVRAAKGHSPYAELIRAMYHLVEAREQTRQTHGRYKMDSRDLAVIHKAVLHSKSTGTLKMYHHEAKEAWFCLLPKHLHVGLEAPQIWDDEDFPGMGGVTSADVATPRFPEEARAK